MATMTTGRFKPLLNPTSSAVQQVLTRTRTLDTLQGKTVTFWHDSTPEADVIFPVIRDHLLERGALEVLLARQPAPASPPQPLNLAMLRRSDAAVLGVAW